MSCYECYRYVKVVRRYQGYVTYWFKNADDEVRSLLTANTYIERGRRLLDEMGASDEYGPWDTSCDAVLTIEKESREPTRLYVFARGHSNLRDDRSPICVITDASRHVLYWFRLEGVQQHLSACELSFLRKGQECVLTVDTRLSPGPRVGRTIITYTLTANGVEGICRVDGVPITAEWESRFP